MRSKIGLLVGWMFVTLTAVGVTSAAVGNVRDNVTDSAPPAFRLQDEPGTSSTIGLNESEPLASNATRAHPDVETLDPASSEKGTPESTTTTTVAAAGQTTTTPPPPNSTTTSTTSPTTTTTVPTSVVKTYTVVGGSVTVEGSQNKVTLLGAVPNSGYSAREEERSDPSKVVVEFESTSHTSKIVIEWKGGQLVEHVEEESD